MNVIQSLISQEDVEINAYLEETKQSIAVEPKKAILGLQESSVQVNRGDLIIDAGAKAVYVATGMAQNGRPIVINRQGKRLLDPEWIVVGALAKTPFLKRVAAKIATDHPNRRVLIYGDAAPNEEQVEKSNTMIESIIDTLKKRTGNNPLPDDDLPSQDKGIPTVTLKMYLDAIKSTKEKTSSGSQVKNEPHPWVKFIDAAGSMEDGTPGDDAPGNQFCPKTAKIRGSK